jgi:hypothetical protein
MSISAVRHPLMDYLALLEHSRKVSISIFRESLAHAGIGADFRNGMRLSCWADVLGGKLMLQYVHIVPLRALCSKPFFSSTRILGPR